MAVIAKWKSGFEYMFKADPQKVCDEISSLGDNVLPQQIVEKARAEDTELHKCFDWDDHSAAEKYRIETARKVVHFLVIKESTVNQELGEKECRAFYKTSDGLTEGYKPSEIVFQVPTEREALLKRALNELQTFQNKYKMLSELSPVFEAIKLVG